MTFTHYTRKRNLGATPEPKGKVRPHRGPLRFVVQKHAASHVHYDFRLELDGVFKSWAMPKGPSMNPSDKRLALLVEDRPLDYRTFEGSILGGTSGAGEAIVWDEGTFHAEGSSDQLESTQTLRRGLEEGSLSFVLKGRKLKGAYTLMRTGPPEKHSWLLIKERDRFAELRDIREDIISVPSGRRLPGERAGRATTMHTKPALLPVALGQTRQEQISLPARPMLASLVKAGLRQEAVIAGFTAPRRTRKYFGALVLGVYDGDRLVYVGHAGGGFSQASLKEVREKLKTLIQEPSPFGHPLDTKAPVTWVRPELVCEVTFSEWTADGLFRQPVFVGLREDNNPREVVREIPREDNGKMQAPKDTGGAANGITVNRRTIKFTHPDKLYWPEEGITKGDLLEYYRKCSRYILPFLLGRPQSLHRFPSGIRQEGVFQKEIGARVSGWPETSEIPLETEMKKIRYLVCTDEASLVYMVNLGCIEMHPWFSRVGKLDTPDYLVLDLDPEGVKFDAVVETALVVKNLLDRAGATSFCKTSGATGLHIFVPLKAKYDYDVARNFAHLIARMVNAELPRLTSLERTPDKRKKKVYIDYLQNAKGQTVVAPYSVRPRPGAPVSTPLEWDEVNPGLDPTSFTIETIFPRLKVKGELFKKVLGAGIDIEAGLERLGDG